jgi:pyruvate/2-oxoglutarate dehydrogenase complex dihydrolipoamide dehydrogenase (E3) component
LHLAARVMGVARRDGGLVLRTGEGEVEGDALLVATGRRPNVDTMELACAGVRFTERGVPVDDSLRTNVKHIYAAGDVVGGPQFTHYAGYQAFIAARNALFPGASKGIVGSVPWTTFTDPEIARVGLTEAEARNKYRSADVGVRLMPMERVDRAVTESDTAGFVKVVHRKNGTVVGATVVAERAGEAIHEWALAISNRLKMSDLASTIHVYPTYSIANQQLASAYLVESFLGGMAGKVLTKLSGLK